MPQFSPAIGRGIQPRANRELVRRADDVRVDAVVAATCIQGAAALAELALLDTGRLALQEARLRMFAPAAEHRLAAICDAHAAKASNEILGLSARRGLLG
jgi:hypothetical protein